MQRAGRLHNFAVQSDFGSLYQRNDFLNGLLFNCCGEIVVFVRLCGLSTMLGHFVFPGVTRASVTLADRVPPSACEGEWCLFLPVLHLIYDLSIFTVFVHCRSPLLCSATLLCASFMRDVVVMISFRDHVSSRPRLTCCAVHGVLASPCCPCATWNTNCVAGRRRARRCGENKKRS